MSIAVPRDRIVLPGGRSVAVRAPEISIIAVVVLTAVAFALRASQLHQSLVGDEVFTYQDIFRRSFGSVLTTVHTGGENSPPLFFLLAWASAKLGDPTVWIRFPSLILGTATVPVAYALGRETFGRIAGVIAAAILAVTPFAVYYGIEARPYATMTFLVTLSTLALVRAVKAQSPWWWVLYVLAAAGAAYSHYTSIFVLGVQALWSLWVCRGRVRAAVIANAAAVLLYLPWLPNLRGKELAVIHGLYPLTARRAAVDVLRPIPGHPGAPLRAIPTVLGLAAIGVCVLAGLIAVYWGWRSARPRPRPAVVLILTVALATPIGLLLYSLLVTDLWLPRGLSASMPATAIILGALLASLPRPASLVATMVVLVTLFAGTLRSFDAAYARGPFRAIATYLDRVAGRRDPVTIVSLAGAQAITEQFHKPHLVLYSAIAMQRSMWHLVPPGGRAYVVLDDMIAQRLKLTTPHPRGFQLIGQIHYGGSFPSELLSYRSVGSD